MRSGVPAMNSESTKPRGVLGRGPIFWAILTMIATAAVVTLGLTEAIENKASLLILLMIPVALTLVMFRSAYRLADSGGATCVAQGQAQKRYIKRVAIFTSLYLATFGLMTFLGDEISEPAFLRFVIAALPGLAVIGIFWAIGRLIVEETDEFIRMLTVRQTLIASAVALSAASIWGFLEAAGLVIHLDAYWYAVIWFGGLFIGALVNRIEHGTWGAA